MTKSQVSTEFLEELADFLVSCPSRKELLAYRPSKVVQCRSSELLTKQNEGEITLEEKWELDQFAWAEVLMRLIKAKLRLRHHQNV